MKILSCVIAVACLFSITLSAQQQDLINDRELRAWAEKGDADSQFELGLRLLTGEGITKNEAEGVKWMEQAAAQKHLRAQFVMGSLYEDGVGVKKDEAKAFEWYRKSAESGFAPGQHAVAMAYDLGRGVKLDPVKATEWLEKAAEQNHAPAQTALAAKYERGVGASKNPSKAALFYLRAAQQDFVPAMSRLANLYYSGTGVPVDYRRAGAWYQRAARSDDPWASNNLAWFLSTCPDESLHNGEKAVQLASRALRIMDEAGEEQRYEMIDTKAACLARNGEYLEAVLWQKKAMTLLSEDKEVGSEERQVLEKEFKTRLDLYQKQTPFTEAEPQSDAEAAPLPQDTILQEEGIPGTPPKSKGSKSKSRGTVV
ncbi:Sel1 repeat-containing protein [Prosthecobacter debontii]|uniref:Sel1 repeat-containing protein n=1 Tax=Prosthecobacter debontii TaxID=48467 RepID=A0A1T4XMH8_9BACT|nr:tetratricopeptide repeat protein [Prosthecobacter debontii]SKA90726.1 Sel1 repeat-containing protein [Prosthecobacter debontii]